jgi:hypothetical protein
MLCWVSEEGVDRFNEGGHTQQAASSQYHIESKHRLLLLSVSLIRQIPRVISKRLVHSICW